jgi:hypothetical protein
MSEDIIYYGIKIVLGIHTDRLPVVHLYQIQLKQLLTLMSLNGEQDKKLDSPGIQFLRLQSATGNIFERGVKERKHIDDMFF